IRRRLESEGMQIDDRKALINHASVREVLYEIVHRSLSLFAMRALQVSKLHQHQVLTCGPTRCSIRPGLQRLANIRKRRRTKRYYGIAGNGMFAVRRHKEHRRLNLRAG